MQPKQTPRPKKWLSIVVGVLVLALIGSIVGGDDENSKASAASVKLTGEDSVKQRKEIIEKGFSAWDGEHIKLKAYIKEHLNDPNSYEHLKTEYWDRDSVLVVKTEYTAKNGFGGRVRGVVMAKASLEGEVLEIMSSTE